MPMTFFDGKEKLADGTEVIFPRQNKVPGQVILDRKTGTSLPNGTYQDSAGDHFTVAGGVIGQLKVAAPVIIEPIIEPAAEVIEPIIVPDAG